MFSKARPDFAELDVFLGQHILLTLEQHFNPKMLILTISLHLNLTLTWVIPKIRGNDRWMILMYKQQTLIISLNFTKVINLFFKSDWLIIILSGSVFSKLNILIVNTIHSMQNTCDSLIFYKGTYAILHVHITSCRKYDILIFIFFRSLALNKKKSVFLFILINKKHIYIKELTF